VLSTLWPPCYRPSSPFSFFLCGCPRFDFLPGSWVTLFLSVSSVLSTLWPPCYRPSSPFSFFLCGCPRFDFLPGSWGCPTHATVQRNLRLPHPWCVRVGSYDRTPQSFFSSFRSSLRTPRSLCPLCKPSSSLCF